MEDLYLEKTQCAKGFRQDLQLIKRYINVMKNSEDLQLMKFDSNVIKKSKQKSIQMLLSPSKSPVWNHENFSMKERSQCEHTQKEDRKEIWAFSTDEELKHICYSLDLLRHF